MLKSRQLRVLGLYLSFGFLLAASCARESNTFDGSPSATSGGMNQGKAGTASQAGSLPMAGTTSASGTGNAFGGTTSTGGKPSAEGGASTGAVDGGGAGGVDGDGGSGGAAGTSTGVPPEVLERASVVVLYQTGKVTAVTRTIDMKLYVRNQSADPLPMDHVKIRYWFTAEAPVTLHQYYVSPAYMAPKAIFVDDGDNSHVLLTFGGGSVTKDLLENESQIQLTCENNTMDYDQSDDFSWLPTATTTAAPNDKITLYLDDTLIWGCEPNGTCFGEGSGGQGAGGLGAGGAAR